MLDVDEVELSLADDTRLGGAFIAGLSPLPGLGPYTSRVSGWFQDRVTRTRGRPAQYAMFLMPNLDARHGDIIRTVTDGLNCGRLPLQAEPWLITLDEVANRTEVSDRLKSESGFGVTHVGRLERTDGQPFDAAIANDVLDAVAAYSSFACGRWTGPCLPVGFDADNRRAWECWRGSRTSPYRYRETWMDVGDPIGSCYREPFAGFFRRWQDEAWREVVQSAIHWYVEACGQAGSIEGSIVLTQTAFELLGSAVLVENESWLSADGAGKLPAEDVLRLLLRWAGIPTRIPSESVGLTRLAKSENWPDLPKALTVVRNKITHPTAKSRQEARRHAGDARRDCYELGLWCLELCLLRLFDYTGEYGNRLTQRFVGQTEPVPWATKQP